MNPLVVSLGKFFGVTLLVGVVGAIIVPSILSFVAFSSLGAIGQVVISWILERLEQIRRAQYEYEQRLDENAILAANTMAVNCAGCKAPQSIPILITERNLFSCRKCKVENVIMVTAETALTTNPIE